MSASRSLDLQGDLALSVDDEPPSRLSVRGRSIVVDLAGANTLRALLASLPRGPARASGLQRARDLLRVADLTFEARVAGRRIARLSGSGRGSWFARRLGLAGLELDLGGLALALIATR